MYLYHIPGLCISISWGYPPPPQGYDSLHRLGDHRLFPTALPTHLPTPTYLPTYIHTTYLNTHISATPSSRLFLFLLPTYPGTYPGTNSTYVPSVAHLPYLAYVCTEYVPTVEHRCMIIYVV